MLTYLREQNKLMSYPSHCVTFILLICLYFLIGKVGLAKLIDRYVCKSTVTLNIHQYPAWVTVDDVYGSQTTPATQLVLSSDKMGRDGRRVGNLAAGKETPTNRRLNEDETAPHPLNQI